jgi:protein lifeguard
MGFIIVDTARLMSKYADPDEYILFAVTLYLDVLNLFLFLLRLLGNK